MIDLSYLFRVIVFCFDVQDFCSSFSSFCTQITISVSGINIEQDKIVQSQVITLDTAVDMAGLRVLVSSCDVYDANNRQTRPVSNLRFFCLNFFITTNTNDIAHFQ